MGLILRMDGCGEEAFCFWVGADLSEPALDALLLATTAPSGFPPFPGWALDDLASPAVLATPDVLLTF